jgi:hypothetical protein
MALFIPHDTRCSKITGTLTLTRIRSIVGASATPIELSSGDLLFVSELSHDPLNENAMAFVGCRDTHVYGDALLCSPSELE